MPLLFQRRFGTEDRPITRSYNRECLVATSQAARITAAGQSLEGRAPTISGEKSRLERRAGNHHQNPDGANKRTDGHR